MQLDRTQPRVLRIIAENSGFNESCIELHHALAADLGCDSLDCIEIMMGLEEEFGVEIDDDDFVKCTTVQQVIDYIADVCTPPANTPRLFERTDVSTTLAALIAAEEFMRGDAQEGITLKLAQIRAAIRNCQKLEQAVATLNKAALDCAMEMDWLKNEFNVAGVSIAKHDAIVSIIARVHAASSAAYQSEAELTTLPPQAASNFRNKFEVTA